MIFVKFKKVLMFFFKNFFNIRNIKNCKNFNFL